MKKIPYNMALKFDIFAIYMYLYTEENIIVWKWP